VEGTLDCPRINDREAREPGMLDVSVGNGQFVADMGPSG